MTKIKAGGKSNLPINSKTGRFISLSIMLPTLLKTSNVMRQKAFGVKAAALCLTCQWLANGWRWNI